MRKLPFWFYFLGLAALVYGADIDLQPIVLSIARINNLDNQLSESEYNNFRTRLEIDIQEKREYFTLIDPQYDKLLIEEIIRSGRYPTRKDLLTLGDWENEDYIILVDLSKTKKGFTTLYQGTMRLFDVKTGGLQTFLEADKEIEAVATELARNLFQRLWQGILIITADNPPFFLTVDDNKIEIKTKGHEALLMRGEHKLIVEKPEYRTETRTIDVNPGDSVPWVVALTRRGAVLRLEGRPRGAHIILESKGKEYKGELPFEKMLAEGEYRLTIAKSGYNPIEDIVVINDGEDKHLPGYDLIPIRGSTIWKRSLLFAGLGQYYYGDRFKGFMFAALEAGGILAGGILTYMYGKEKKDRDNLNQEYQNNSENFNSIRTNIQSKEEWMRRYQGGAIIAIITAAVTYGYNIYDIYGYRGTQKKIVGKRTRQRADEAFEELDEIEKSPDE